VGAALVRQRLAFRQAASGNDDFGTFGDEDFRRPQADAAGSTRDHRDLAVSPSHALSFSIRLKFI
jgi:hypothetical protein